MAARQVVEWRARRLEHAGFDPPLAAELASVGEVDLHRLLELIDRGCPPRLAARILAPLEDEVRNLAYATQRSRDHRC
jgi:hypothetical protein